ncbi:MAG TPA: class I SAM-dependent methyltransferase [Burkholderiales bacterium]|nr:class I SAM-dependent methyltransferase [Burkholderiales bacterium]
MTDAFAEFERSRWQSVAAPYHDYFGALTSQSIGSLLDAVAAARGTRLLDVASGPGYVAAAAVRRGARATGVDFSSEMVAQARRLHRGVDYREGDAQALPFGAGSFDAVVVAYGLLHFSDPDRALAEARRVLAPGGRVAFSVWAAPERAVAFAIVLDAVKTHGDPAVPLPPGPPFFRFSDPAECVRALTAAGFERPHVAELSQTWRLASPAALFQAMLESTARTGALLRAQAPAALARVRAAIESGAAAHAGAGGIDLAMPAVIASAVVK